MVDLNLSSSSISLTRYFHTCTVTCVVLLSFLTHAKCLYFNYSGFDKNDHSLFYEADAGAVGGKIQLTKNQRDAPSGGSVGRASYDTPVPLWDNTTRELTNFTTHFSFEIIKLGNNTSYYMYGDGFTFFLAPFDSKIPPHSLGGSLGLVSNRINKSQIVAVEFDNFRNLNWDPWGDHVGIDVGSVVSNKTASWGNTEHGFENSTTANVQISYDSTTCNLSVFLTFDKIPVFPKNSILSYIIDLRTILPEAVRVGFSAATGQSSQISNILSWEFNSSLSDAKPAQAPEPVGQITSPKSSGPARKSKNIKVRFVSGAVVVVSVLSIGLGLVGFMWWRRRSDAKEDGMVSDLSDDFESGTGPRRFTYGELSRATNNFVEERKLGEGGFGGVYLGLLSNPHGEIAVKKVSRGSRQGKKEYISEVRIISRLRHKNLVQLLGWCHERGDLILVYEFMPNGSLDSHLYGGKKDALSWTVRYKIALDLASALVYLHEDWEQCVLHRDIKSSNVMLDSNFNVKLGDFGLARLVDHELGAQTTVLAGTFGYLAPECSITGKASKESDVYSFGVVALEIACGRRPIEIKEEPTKVRMIEWIWDLYGKGLLLEAIDHRLEGDFNAHQTECLMTVGLWCCHPDCTLRPSMNLVTKVLKFEAPLPVLPTTFPVPIYSSISMNETMDIWSIPSSSGFSGSTGATTSSSHSHVSGSAPLLSEKANAQ